MSTRRLNRIEWLTKGLKSPWPPPAKLAVGAAPVAEPTAPVTAPTGLVSRARGGRPIWYAWVEFGYARQTAQFRWWWEGDRWQIGYVHPIVHTWSEAAQCILGGVKSTILDPRLFKIGRELPKLHFSQSVDAKHSVIFYLWWWEGERWQIGNVNPIVHTWSEAAQCILGGIKHWTNGETGTGKLNIFLLFQCFFEFSNFTQSCIFDQKQLSVY